MKVVAIVPFSGRSKLVEMTRACVRSIAKHCDVVAVNNNAYTKLELEADNIHEIVFTKNHGFGIGVNLGIEHVLEEMPEATHVLVANNDLVFHDDAWYDELVKEVESSYVLAPGTDKTATKAALAKSAVDKPATFADQVSAYCWLVPLQVVRRIRRRYGFNLFDPSFFAYGEDDLTGAILRKQYGPRPFKIVHRSWVHHIKGQTAKEIPGVFPGNKTNLKLVRMRKRALGL